MSTQNSIKNISIVDDEKPLANALVAKFQAAGYEAQSLYDGEAVAKELQKHSYDAILLDLLMPSTDGWTVLEAIKGMGVPVIITSNLSQEEDIKRAKELGATDFMVKSEVSLSEIVDRVEVLLTATQ